MSWSFETHLLATVVDALAALTYVTLRAAGAKPPKPRTIARPGRGRPASPPPTAPVVAPGKRTGSWSALASSLRGQRGVVEKGVTGGG
jgi:hypothetical protein